MVSVTSAFTPSRSSRSMLAESSPRSPQAPSVSYESDNTGSRKYSEFLYFSSNFVDDMHTNAQVFIYLKILS